MKLFVPTCLFSLLTISLFGQTVTECERNFVHGSMGFSLCLDSNWQILETSASHVYLNVGADKKIVITNSSGFSEPNWLLISSEKIDHNGEQAYLRRYSWNVKDSFYQNEVIAITIKHNPYKILEQYLDQNDDVEAAKSELIRISKQIKLTRPGEEMVPMDLHEKEQLDAFIHSFEQALRSDNQQAFDSLFITKQDLSDILDSIWLIEDAKEPTFNWLSEIIDYAHKKVPIDSTINFLNSIQDPNNDFSMSFEVEESPRVMVGLHAIGLNNVKLKPSNIATDFKTISLVMTPIGWKIVVIIPNTD